MQHRPHIYTLTAAAVFLATSAQAEPSRDQPAPAPLPELSDEVPASPDGFQEMFVAGVLPTEGGQAVVLRDRSERTIVPIWIGAPEAFSIQLRLERRRFPRPLTHDLLDAILHDLGGEVVKVHVDDMKGEAFVGTVFVRQGDKIVHFDARASDSIALAVGNGAPIFVSTALIERMSVRHQESAKSPASGGEDADTTETPPIRSKPRHELETL